MSESVDSEQLEEGVHVVAVVLTVAEETLHQHGALLPVLQREGVLGQPGVVRVRTPDLFEVLYEERLVVDPVLIVFQEEEAEGHALVLQLLSLLQGLLICGSKLGERERERGREGEWERGRENQTRERGEEDQQLITASRINYMYMY